MPPTLVDVPARTIAAGAAAVVVAYFCTGWLGFALAIPPGNVTAIWPPSGIAFAAALVYGPRVWWAIWLGSFLTNTVFFSGVGLPVLTDWLTSGGIATGSTLQALLGAAMVRRLVGLEFLDHPEQVVRFVTVEAACCVIASTMGTGSLSLAGLVAPSAFSFTWLTWWLGDLMGVLIFSPVLLSLRRAHLQWPKPGLRPWEFLLHLSGILMVGYATFASGSRLPLFFLLIPFVLWAACRFGRTGVSLSILVVSLTVIWGTSQGSGGFTTGSPHETLLMLQTFVGFLGVTGLMLAAALRERQILHANLEQQVQARTQELSRSVEQLQATNQELETFAYTISHDLRAPIRHINAFAGLLKERSAGRLEKDEELYLSNITHSSNRMGRLIDALLRFARTSDIPVSPSPVDLNEVVKQTIEEASCEIAPKRNIRWEIAPLPTVQADSQLIRIVMSNLISNALKYTSRTEEPCIEIGHHASGGEHTFYVRDNGAGFDMAHAGRLFGVFERLHSAEEFEGLGIGLALARRIVERHGGKIRADSKPGQGATFYFTLPLASPISSGK
jgi:signal transduction histidine kinase